MPSIIHDKTTNGKFVVRADRGEWTFDTQPEAQKKATYEMWLQFSLRQALRELGDVPDVIQRYEYLVEQGRTGVEAFMGYDEYTKRVYLRAEEILKEHLPTP